MSSAIHPRFAAIGKAGLFFALPLVVFGWTSIPFLATYTLHAGLVLFLAAVAGAFVKRGADSAGAGALQLVKTSIYTLVVLMLVGGTGWFLSPFFFLLYLLPFYLGFLYAPAVAFGFLAALLIVFASSIGEVDMAFDIMTLLSLLLVIPLVIYLRRRYLILRQSSKDILILQEESGIKDMDTIEKLLANRITNLGVNVRQPLTFIKQAAILMDDKKLSSEEERQIVARIRTTAAQTLDMIRKFEGESSANVVIRNTQNQIKKPS